MFILFTTLLLLPILLFLIIIFRNILGKTYIISIEGNIGSGKSTLVKKLKQANPTWFFLQEPVDVWKSVSDIDGNNILSEFYKDKKRNAYLFQNFAFITRLHTLKTKLKEIKRNTSIFKDNYLIVERSIHSDKNVFAKLLHNDKEITNLEYEIYNYWFYRLHSSALISAHVYLKVDPKISSKRIVKRDRKEEKNAIPIEYLNSLHDYHEDWIDKTPIPTLIVSGDNDFEKNSKIFNTINDQITSFIDEL